MHFVTGKQFSFADQLTQQTIIFRQSLVLHCCMHISHDLPEFRRSTPELVWLRILSCKDVVNLDVFYAYLLFEMVRHTVHLTAHDHPNPLVGTWQGGMAMWTSGKELNHAIMQKKLVFTRNAVTQWAALLSEAGLDMSTANNRTAAWVAVHAVMSQTT